LPRLLGAVSVAVRLRRTVCAMNRTATKHQIYLTGVQLFEARFLPLFYFAPLLPLKSF